MDKKRGIFPYILKNAKIVRELLKELTGSDPGSLEHLLLCGRDEHTCDINLNVDYSVFEDDCSNMYAIGIYHEPMYPDMYAEFLHNIIIGYTEARFGWCLDIHKYTVIGLIPVSKPKHCEKNDFLIPMWEQQENPAIAEMMAVLFDDECAPVTALGKATQEHLISIWGENYWE